MAYITLSCPVPTTTTTTTTTTTSTTTTTTTSSPITYFYYSIKKYDCANSCAYVTPDLVGRSSTSLSTSNSIFYKIGSFVYQIQTTAETNIWDIDLDGAPSNLNCTIACSL
jgi:hypothetical protein